MNTSKQPPEQISGPQVYRLRTAALRPFSTLSSIALTCIVLTCMALPGIANAEVSEWIELRSANGHLQLDTKVAGIPGYSILFQETG